MMILPARHDCRAGCLLWDEETGIQTVTNTGNTNDPRASSNFISENLQLLSTRSLGFLAQTFLFYFIIFHQKF